MCWRGSKELPELEAKYIGLQLLISPINQCMAEIFPLFSHEDHNIQSMRSHYKWAVMNIKCLIHIRSSKYIDVFGCGLAEYVAGEQQFFPLQQASILSRWSDEGTGSTMVRTHSYIKSEGQRRSQKAPKPLSPDAFNHRVHLPNPITRPKNMWVTENKIEMIALQFPEHMDNLLLCKNDKRL